MSELVISVLDSIIPYLKRGRGELDMFLEEKGIICFQKIFEEFEREEPVPIISYIVYAYSKDSPYLVLGRDHAQEKLYIAEKIVDLPEYLKSACVQLKNETVSRAIGGYLDMQDAPVFKRLKYKQDLYESLSNSLIKDMSSENVDVKTMVENDKYLDRLLHDIHELEDKLRQRYSYVYINKEDLNSKKEIKEVSGAVENSEHIQ